MANSFGMAALSYSTTRSVDMVSRSRLLSSAYLAIVSAKTLMRSRSARGAASRDVRPPKANAMSANAIATAGGFAVHDGLRFVGVGRGHTDAPNRTIATRTGTTTIPPTTGDLAILVVRTIIGI